MAILAAVAASAQRIEFQRQKFDRSRFVHPASPAAAPSAAPKTSPGKWLEDFDEAVAAATAANLPLFLNFTGSDWCPWCKFADDRVFSRKEWKHYAASRLVLVVVDFPRKQPLPKKQSEANQALAQRFGVGGFPTFLILSPDGRTVLGRLGISRDANFDQFPAQVDRILAAAAPASP